MRVENLRRLAEVRDHILERAAIRPGETVLDVGTGQGLLGLEALQRSGPDGRVIFSDISGPLLDDCRGAVAQVRQPNERASCGASATDLSADRDAPRSTSSSSAQCSCLSRIGHVPLRSITGC